MRILKSIKPSDNSVHCERESGGLSYSIEEVDLNQNDGSLDWLNGSGENATSKNKKKKNKTSGGLDAELDAADNNQGKIFDESKKEYNRLFVKGVRLLSMREHSKHEIITKLSVKCENLDTVYAVVDFLIENKYLSDERFTESYIRFRRNRGFGPNKIRIELKDKGIQNNMIDDHLDVKSSTWFDNAENQYKKKYGDDRVKDYNTWAKRARFMQSRGFSMEHIQVTLPAVDHD